MKHLLIFIFFIFMVAYFSITVFLVINKNVDSQSCKCEVSSSQDGSEMQRINKIAVGK
jgi:hypothetical protein